MSTHYHLFETSLGLCGIAWSDDGITRFRLPDPDRAAAEKALGAKATTQGEPPPRIAAAIGAEARRYFDGARIDFSGARARPRERSSRSGARSAMRCARSPGARQ